MPIHRTNNLAHAVDYTFSYEPFRREPHGRTSGLPSYLSENDLPGVQFLLLANDHRNIFTRIYVEIRSTAQLSAVDFRKQPRNCHYLSTSYRFADIGSGRPMLQLLAKRALASAFDDNQVRILVDAFDQAWKAVQDSGAPFASEGHMSATRERLALRIIEIAQLGERDPNRLRDDALLYLARTNLKSAGR